MSSSPNTSDVKTLERLINSDGISKRLNTDYPRVSELLQWDLEKTASALCLVGAFQLFKVDQHLRYAQQGSEGAKTWSDYRNGIHQYFKTINDDRRLEPARTVLANHIYDIHLKKFPSWPTAVEKMQQSEVFIDIASSYPFQAWYVGWSCMGFITVQDFRANENSFYTDFHGRPELKILYCNERKLQEFEQLAENNMVEAKQIIEKTNNILSFDSLRQMISNS